MAEIIYLPRPKELTPEQRQHWLDEAAKWGVIEEEAARKREDALRMLGMIGIEKGLMEDER
jgi:hypothetical protein